MSLLKSQWQLIVQELRSNDRLRWGLGVICVLALIYLSMVFSDVNALKKQEFYRLGNERAELSGLETDSLWQQRLTLENQQISIFYAQLWQAESESLALADIQSELVQVAHQAELTAINIKMGTLQPHADLQDVRKVRARFRANYQDDQILKFLNRVESHNPVFVFERLDLKINKGKGSVDALIVSYVKLIEEDV